MTDEKDYVCWNCNNSMRNFVLCAQDGTETTDDETIRYICCPACDAIYELTVIPGLYINPDEDGIVVRYVGKRNQSPE
jgi:hypothetical protein